MKKKKFFSEKKERLLGGHQAQALQVDVMTVIISCFDFE